MSAGTREPGGRYGCRGCSQEIIGVCGSECWICIGLCVPEPQHGCPHMKCCLCLQCQDLFQCYISAAHHDLWFIKGVIKGCQCQGPDGSSVLD